MRLNTAGSGLKANFVEEIKSRIAVRELLVNDRPPAGLVGPERVSHDPAGTRRQRADLLSRAGNALTAGHRSVAYTLTVYGHITDEKYYPRDDEPERPGDVGDRDDRAREVPALLFEAADELQRTDDEEAP